MLRRYSTTLSLPHGRVAHEVRSRQVIRQHCPKIASGEAELRASPRMSDPPRLALAGPTAVRGSSGRTDVSSPAKWGMPRPARFIDQSYPGRSMRSLVIED